MHGQANIQFTAIYSYVLITITLTNYRPPVSELLFSAPTPHASPSFFNRDPVFSPQVCAPCHLKINTNISQNNTNRAVFLFSARYELDLYILLKLDLVFKARAVRLERSTEYKWGWQQCDTVSTVTKINRYSRSEFVVWKHERRSLQVLNKAWKDTAFTFSTLESLLLSFSRQREEKFRLMWPN